MFKIILFSIVFLVVHKKSNDFFGQLNKQIDLDKKFVEGDN